MDSSMHYFPRPQDRGQLCIELSTVPRGIVLTILPNRHEITVFYITEFMINDQNFTFPSSLNLYLSSFIGNIRLTRGVPEIRGKVP